MENHMNVPLDNSGVIGQREELRDEEEDDETTEGAPCPALVDESINNSRLSGGGLGEELHPDEMNTHPQAAFLMSTTSTSTASSIDHFLPSSGPHHQQQFQLQQQHLHHQQQSRRDHNIDYSTLFVQLTGTFPTLYRCVNCHKTVSNRWHHANIHRPQSHACPICGQKFTRRDNMKAHCKIKHADLRANDSSFSHYVQM